MARLRVLIVAGDTEARAALTATLRAQPSLDVVSADPLSAGPLEDLTEDSRAGLVVLDADSVEHTRAWLGTGRAATSPVLVLTARPRTARAALAAGARGVIRRTAGAQTLRDAIAAAARGLTVLDPAVVSALGVPADGDDEEGAVEPLTPREREVLALLAEGLTNRQIAARLRVSEHTVKFHVDTILDKLGARSRTEAVTRAVRTGLIVL